MAKNESKKLAFTLFLISLSFHLIVFAASSHEYVWNRPNKTSRPLKFRVVSVEKPKEKLPLNPQSRFLSNANRKESASGNPSKTPRLKRGSKDQVSSRRGRIGPRIASSAPASKSKAPAPAVSPVSPKPAAIVMPKPQAKKVEKSKENKAPETSEAKETPKSKEMARLAPEPGPLPEALAPAVSEKKKPKAREKTNQKKKKPKIVVKDKRETKPVVKKKTLKKVVKKKLPKKKESKKIELKRKTKEKLKMAALKPVSRPIQPQRSAPKRPQPKDPLALFRVKPQPTGKPKHAKFDLSDEVADRIAKRSLSDNELENEEGETISLDTRDFRYASYFAHLKRRIQNAWIWPEEAQKNRGKLLLRFKLRKNGTLEEVRLIKSAGIRILDDLAMAAVTKAAPFDPFPAGLKRKTITATFVYD